MNFRFLFLYKFLLLFAFLLLNCVVGLALEPNSVMRYKVSVTEPASHCYRIELRCANLQQDTIRLKMPKWMPGYYQIIDYAKSVENLTVAAEQGRTLSVTKQNDNTWLVAGVRNKSFVVDYTIRTQTQFVANSYVDSDHAYIIPENTFLYIDGCLNIPVTVSLSFPTQWNKVATGLDPVAGKSNEFTASDFDLLYDCPILIGNLQELPSFKVKGVEHRFIGYKMVDFNHPLFIEKLKNAIEKATQLIGDIPYKRYTFIGIGPGRGGIEHLNNTTISFDGMGLDTPEAINKTMNFIVHEYFHHYNVKRIRPYELGPFDYDKGNKTNMLWVSEGLTVYYEYLIVKRAGLVDETTLLSFLDTNLNTVENDSGRFYQSLQQSSYDTWSDGPFGVKPGEVDKAISYYDKGPVVGLLLDFAIRHATQNQKSLDDLMRTLYWKFYKPENRGFTEAELQQTCEELAGISLSDFLEYIYTTKELDYAKYLAYGGLKLDRSVKDATTGIQKVKLVRLANPTALQSAILKSWLGE